MTLFDRSLLDLKYWPGHDNTSDQEPDIDICTCCGRAYGHTPSLEALWRKSNPRPSGVMPQLCYRCMAIDVGEDSVAVGQALSSTSKQEDKP